MRPSYLNNGNLYTCKTQYLYWDSPQILHYKWPNKMCHKQGILPGDHYCYCLMNTLSYFSSHCFLPGDWMRVDFIYWHPIFNTLRPKQNGRHFADDNLKCIFSNENIWISIKISLKFVPKGPINNIPALVQMMAWRRPGHYLKQCWLDYRLIYASLGLNELNELQWLE